MNLSHCIIGHPASSAPGQEATNQQRQRRGCFPRKQPDLLRCSAVSFNHHREVAALPSAEADALLEGPPPTAHARGCGGALTRWWCNKLRAWETL